MAPKAASAAWVGPRSQWEIHAAFACDNCNRLLLAKTNSSQTSPDSQALLGIISAKSSASITWLPKAGDSKSFENVPAHIADAASEAHECSSIGCHRAAVAMSRAVIEATAKEKQIISGSLNNKINAMAEAGYLRSATAEMAHEVRHWGNDMAHGDFTKPISADEAEGVLALMGEILQEVFQAPALLARIRSLRQQAAEPTQNLP